MFASSRRNQTPQEALADPEASPSGLRRLSLGSSLAPAAIAQERDPRAVFARAAVRLFPSTHALAPAVSRGSTRPWPKAALLLLAPLVLMVFARYLFIGTDNDYWWHVRTGQLIVETGAVPRVDVYSHTVGGQPWTAHEWLTEVILYAVERHVGYFANVALFGLAGTLTALAVYATCRLRGLGEPAAAILMLWAWAMGIGSVNIRAQLLTTLLAAVVTLLLTMYRRGQTRALWPIPPLLALWVNLHGGYLIGLLLLGLTIIGEAGARLLGRPAAPLRPLVAVTALATLATLLSPHGLDGLLYPLTYAGTGTSMMRYIVEWQSPDFHRPHLLIFAASLLLAVLLGLGRRPLGPTDALWGLALALMALQSVRHIALYAVVVTPLLAARLLAELPALGRPLATWRRPALVGVTWLLLAVLVPRLALEAGGLDGLQLGRQPSTAGYPTGAVEYLRANSLPGNLYNTYDWGGYLIYQLYPERRVFVDGRTDVYAAFMRRYMQVAMLEPGWRQVLDEHDVRLVLVDKTEPLAVVLADDPAWQTAYSGEVERLYVRR